MNNKIVTNLRVDKDEWQQIKIMAAELGISVNEYVNYAIKSLSIKNQLGDLKKTDIKKKKKISIWDLADLAEIKNKFSGELSEEDEIIYGLDK